MQKLSNNLGVNISLGAKAENIAKTTFAKLGMAEPTRKRKKNFKPKKSNKRRKEEKELFILKLYSINSLVMVLFWKNECQFYAKYQRRVN